jgi:HSP20 family protein
MKVTRWEPFREMEQFLGRFPPAGLWSTGRALPGFADERFQWSPSADISETEKEYLVRAELPAVRKEDVEVTVDDGVMRIHGVRRQEKTDKDEKFHRVETFTGEFSRMFTLPPDADVAAVRAESRDGVLTVHIPKHASAKKEPLQIRVN